MGAIEVTVDPTQRAEGPVVRRSLASWSGPLAAVFALYGALFAAWTIFHWGGAGRRDLLNDVAFLPVSLTAALFAWLASTRLEGRLRLGWFLLALGFGAWWLGDLSWFVQNTVLASSTFPSWSDVGYLAFYPLVFCGLVCLTSPASHLPGSHTDTRTERLELALDAAMVVIGGSMIVWYLVIGPSARNQTLSSALLVSLAYPVGDLVLLFAVALLLLRGAASDSNPALLALLASLTAIVVADIAFARLDLSGSAEAGAWPDALWMTGQCLMIASAAFQLTRTSRVTAAPETQAPPVRTPRVPYVAALCAYVLLALVAVNHSSYPIEMLIYGSMLLTAVVMMRQIVALKQNERLLAEAAELAATDTLTGIHSRRSLLKHAEAEFALSRAFDLPLGAIMIDIDRFKTINDTHGHVIGDQVLKAVARICSDGVRTGDIIGRYGGDELIAILPGADETQALEVATRLRDDVRNRAIPTSVGPITVTLSLGVATSAMCEDLEAQLRRADACLYAAKEAGRDCARVTPALT